MNQKNRPLYIPYMGPHLLETPILNKSSAFPLQERIDFKLNGLIPEKIETIEEQAQRSYAQFLEKKTAIDKHIYLRSVQDVNTTLFYKLLCDHMQEMLPIVYTPTVGHACELFSTIYSRARGLFLSYPQRDHIRDILNNVTLNSVRIIVITDGARILGLGDQGIGGMSIPIGKLSLYTACGGISPAHTLPLVIDVGTNNQTLLNDPMYMGWHHERIDGDEYFAFVDQILTTIVDLWPNVLVQFEDFALAKANQLLASYRDQFCCFNDDIQGTAAITLGTIISFCRKRKELVSDQRFVFSGAGSAGCGIAQQIIDYMVSEGTEREVARSKICLMNSSGVLFEDTAGLYDFQKQLAQPRSLLKDWNTADPTSLVNVIANFTPSVLVGVSGQSGLFTQQVIETMLTGCDKPLVLPLSNPTKKSEGAPADIIKWSNNRATIATGSPYEPVRWQDQTIHISQCNNVYIFPGIGLGVLISDARRVTDAMMMAAAKALAEQSQNLSTLLPPVERIREVSRHVAMKVAMEAVESGVATAYSEATLQARLEDTFWEPEYRSYRLKSI